MVAFATRIPPHGAITDSGRGYPKRRDVCQMTGSLREHIREAIPRQHDAAFGKGLDGGNVVCGQNLSVLLILTAAELAVAVGVLFRHGEAFLSGPSLKTGFRQFR